MKKILEGDGAKIILDIWEKNNILPDMLEYMEDENDK